jgi:hypothetical protein
MRYDVDCLIKIYVNPLLEEECKKLKIPRDFIKGVYGCYYNGIAGYVEEIREDDKLVGVRIRIANCNNSRGVLSVFSTKCFALESFCTEEKNFYLI